MNTYSNPVKRGFFPDPSVIRVGDDYYMVNSTFQYFPAIPISHSKDLVHWEIIGHAITDNSYLDLSDIMDSRGIWAPDISYYNGKFYIFATLRYNYADGKTHPMRAQLVMTSDKPQGPYSKPVILPVDNIDPSHFVDDDGKHYMIIAPGITVVPLNDVCTQVIGEPIQVWAGTGERCPEGPHILKKDNWYYAIIAEGGTGYGHGINVARSKSLFGEYELCPYNPVMRQTDRNASIQRTGHGKLVQTQTGQWWCTYLCGRPNANKYTTVGRETALDPVHWTEDGWFIINDTKPSIVQKIPDLPVTKYNNTTFYDFNDADLSLDWEWVRNPNNSLWNIKDSHINLITGDYTLDNIKAVNTLLRREEELCFEASTKMLFKPEIYGQQAGITCYYSTVTYIRFSLTYNNSLCLELVINRNCGEELIKRIDNIKEGYIYLKVQVEYLTRKFYYSYDNENWILAAELDNCVYLCDEGVPDDPKRHTGTLTGIYANNGGTNKYLTASFDWFLYKNKEEN